MKKPIYFDNAATSWPKPESVYTAMDYFMRNVGANPGRSGHSKSVEAGRIVYETREAIAQLFNVQDSTRVVFTSNGTHAINLVLKGMLQPKDHVLITSMEHNAVMRPLRYLEKSIGIRITVIPCSRKGTLSLELLEEKIEQGTKLIVAIHASNVTGVLMPLQEIGQISRRHGVPLLVDAAQTAGTIRLDMVKQNIDLLTFTGHKGLMGPQGIGGLCIGEPGRSIEISPLIQGGTGSNSEAETHPDFLPDKFESGTLNTVGIAGLGAGVKFIQETGIDRIEKHEKALTKQLLNGLSGIEGIKLYGFCNPEKQISVVSFNIKGSRPCDIGYMLDREYGIVARVGLHCAPLAHKTIGAFPGGTVRFSLSYFNKPEEVDYAIDALKKIVVQLKSKGGC